MKKEYVKPQNRVVNVSYRLMDTISQGDDTGEWGAKKHFDDNNSDDYSDDIWED